MLHCVCPTAVTQSGCLLIKTKRFLKLESLSQIIYLLQFSTIFLVNLAVHSKYILNKSVNKSFYNSGKSSQKGGQKMLAPSRAPHYNRVERHCE